MCKCKPKRKVFIEKARAAILARGARPIDDGRDPARMESFALDTKAGKLTILLDKLTSVLLGTVFTRFDDVEAAKKIVDCNPFSGKWNHHYASSWTVELAIEDLDRQLGSVL